MALATAFLVGCGTTTPSPPPADSGAWKGADLLAVVTGNDVNALVGIDVAGRTITEPSAIEENLPQPHMDGGLMSIPPLSVVLDDANGPSPVLWTVASGFEAVVLRELDPTTGEVSAAGGGPAAGVLPFLFEGKLAWASAPDDGQPRILVSDGSFELTLPAVPYFVVAGPGPGRITTVVELGNRNERIFVIDVATRTAMELPTERLHYGGLWANDTTLVASVFSRIEPTPEDPENGEPDNRLLTWTIDPAASPDAVAGLVEGEALPTDQYPELVVGGNGVIATLTGNFDRPQVEVHARDGGAPVRKVQLVEGGYISAMQVSGSTLVVLQSRHVTFVDLASDAVTTVELGGTTLTRWVGR